MKKQVIAISLAAMTAFSLMACSGQKSEATASSDAKVESKDTKDGKEDLVMVLELEPDILISDIKMPKMTGIEIIQNARKLFLHSTANRAKIKYCDT